MFLIELIKYVGIDLSGNIGDVVHHTIEGVDLSFILYSFSAMVFYFFCHIIL
jgi:hypothetical protein